MKTATISEVCSVLKEQNNFEILTHNYPDGDTLGCGYALCLALQQMGKNARVINCSLPSRFEYLTKGVLNQSFECDYVISVDIASPQLMGDNRQKYEDKIDLCIDHHNINTMQAELKCVDSSAAAACEIIYKIISALPVQLTREIANCIYTGISTDTGCFRYTNTTPNTHTVASKLMEYGCDWQKINKDMFETKTRQKLNLERMLYDTISFYANGKCAVICVTLEMQKKADVSDDEMEGIASIPRQIEGVLIGITMREKQDGSFKISVRTNGDVDASKFCANFGGGGHRAAAGCTVFGTKEQVKKQLSDLAEQLI